MDGISGVETVIRNRCEGEGEGEGDGEGDGEGAVLRQGVLTVHTDILRVTKDLNFF